MHTQPPPDRSRLPRPEHKLPRPRKLHRQVEARIRQHVLEGKLGAGAQLPTETEFCRMFDVSRSTVRNALKRLEKAGLITRTRGRGTFLSERDFELQPDADPSSASGLEPGDQFSPGYARERRANGKAELQPSDDGHRPWRRPGRDTIGVVFSYASEIDVMQTAILRGIEHAVQSRGYGLLLGRTDDYDEVGELNSISKLVQHGVAGMIVLPISNQPSTAGVRLLLKRRIPVVLVDRYLTGLDTGYVVSDNFTGMHRAAEHLALLGFRSFEFVVGLAGGTAKEQLTTTSVRDRYHGYCQALREYNLAGAIRGPRAIDLADSDSVCRLIQTAPGRPALPPAIVAAHDYVAVELMKTAARIDLRPPRDYAIVGFDDLPIASHLSVPLTTVVQPRYDIGFRAGHLLLDKIGRYPVRGVKLSLPVSLVVRESCGAHHLARQRLAGAVPAPA